MRTDEMIRQVKGVVHNFTELAARLGVVELEFKKANDLLNDETIRFCKILRIEYLDYAPLSDIVEIVEIRERRRRELEAAVQHVIKTLTEPRFPETAVHEARIELERLFP